MTISVEQVRKLVDEYWGYEAECSNSGSFDRARIYRAVISDLEGMLPRKSMADADHLAWPNFVGAWVEHDGAEKVVFEVDKRMSTSPIGVFDPKTGAVIYISPEEALLTDYSPAWDTEGNPA